MIAEMVPDSTYEIVEGLDKQIKEIREVIEFPWKHPPIIRVIRIVRSKGRSSRNREDGACSYDCSSHCELFVIIFMDEIDSIESSRGWKRQCSGSEDDVGVVDSAGWV